MGRAMGLLMTGVVLVVAGCGGSSSSSSTASSAPASSSTAASASSSTSSAAPAAAGGGGSTVHFAAVPGKLAFNTKTLTAKAGEVTLSMTNPSSFPHGVGVNGNGVDKDGKVVQQGGTSTVTVKLKPGTYTFYCPVPGHKAAGMKGTLTVT
jgi:plastocyanin